MDIASIQVKFFLMDFNIYFIIQFKLLLKSI